jgi:hypothetical protein
MLQYEKIDENYNESLKNIHIDKYMKFFCFSKH